ncbi:hypothetical protein H8E77_18985, partial [bacterium]|nr:hypothetical protein [bacterium]
MKEKTLEQLTDEEFETVIENFIEREAEGMDEMEASAFFRLWNEIEKNGRNQLLRWKATFMKHLLIYGPRQRTRQEILLEELSAYFDRDGKRLNAMIFAPTRRKVVELKSQILIHFERNCWMPEVVTFSQFMESHYGEVLGDRQILSP